MFTPAGPLGRAHFCPDFARAVNSQITFIWDNSYSTWTAKTVYGRNLIVTKAGGADESKATPEGDAADAAGAGAGAGAGSGDAAAGAGAAE